jgi:hypothetical protein
MKMAKEIEAKSPETAKFWKSMSKSRLLIAPASFVGLSLVR